MSHLAKLFKVWTDGACYDELLVIGWGVVIRCFNTYGLEEYMLAYSGGELGSRSCYRAEVMAVYLSLLNLQKFVGAEVKIYTDHKHVWEVFQHLESYALNGWMRKSKPRNRIAEADLWMQIHSLCQKLIVTCELVEGHSGIPDNEHADKLASNGARICMLQATKSDLKRSSKSDPDA